MEHYVYIRERRQGSRRVKTPFQSIEYWRRASGASLEAVPIFKGKGLTTEAWRLPDGRLVEATLLSAHDVASRELLEQIADSLVRDHSAENMSRLEKILRKRSRE